MSESNQFEKKIVPPVSEIVPPVSEEEQLENQTEQEIDNEILSLESNLEGFKQDIENIGGEDALQKELDKNELLSERWKNKFNRTKMLLNSIALGASTAVLGFADKNILPQINWDIADDKTMGQYITAVTIIGLIGTIATFTEFIKNQKKVNAASKILSYE